MSIDISAIKRHDAFYMPGGNFALLAPQKPNHDDSVSNDSESHISEAMSSKLDFSESHDSQLSVYTVFRLHTSMLPIWSSHFATMIEGTIQSSDAAANELYDGVPVVLMPDSAADLESLLNAAFHGFELPAKINVKSLDIIEPVLLMATKYKFERLRAQIVQRLEADWPTTTKAWLSQDTAIRNENSGSKGPQTWADAAAPSAPAFISLARNCDVPSILPSAFYSLFCQKRPYEATFIPEVYTTQRQHMGSTVDDAESHWQRTWDSSRIYTEWPSLTSKDVFVFVKMVHIIDTWLIRDLEQHSSSCSDYVEKPRILGRPKRHLVSEEYFDLPGTFWKPLQQLEIDPLECLRELQRRRMSKHSGELSCRQLPCRMVLDKEQERAIEELWDSFRAIFGLPPLCTVEPFQP